MDWARNADWPKASHSRFVLSKPHKWHVQELGHGPTVLLLHGAGGATQTWRHMYDQLIGHYRIIAIDLPGQGFTKMGTPKRCGLEAMSEDIARLCNQEGWHVDAVVGHSAGGAIALQLASSLSPSPPVIGINPALGNFKGLAGVAFPLIAKVLASTPWVAQLFTASTSRPHSVDRLLAGTGSILTPEDQVFYRRLISDKAHVEGTLAMMAQWRLDPLLAALPEMSAPTLFITGSGDKAVPPTTSTKIAAIMPDAKVIEIAGLGHLAHEEDGQAVASHIISFLNSRLN
ncbi:alpha/beta fold hydrolase BchO [uncultured Litoreibacter sp.]|uniref:alpha/beta fold hydrolase BchO n=1 Tax=uncultured Litoreibacter sp. TaxID=1392394 RepID=UPI002607C890|nr:alpha/beta fold hydrolase BchO [uncultured Litoreibacter sp.]